MKSSQYSKVYVLARRWWRVWKWIVLAVLWLGTLILGWFGFHEYRRTTVPTLGWLDKLYLSLQLFVLESGAVDAPGWKLQWARFLAPAVAGVTLLQVVAVVAAEQWRRVFVRFHYRRHVVVCGLGRVGLPLVKALRAENRRVVVIESNEGNDGIELCRDLGAVVFVGDATEEALLKRAAVRRCRHLFCLCGDDGSNVEVATQARKLVKQSPRGLLDQLIAGIQQFNWGLNSQPQESWEESTGVHCHVHIGDLQLCELLREHGMVAEEKKLFHVRWINFYRHCARALFEQQPLDYEPILPDDPRRVHLIVIGFGDTGEAVMLQAARIGHFANRKRMLVTVFDREATRLERLFRHHYPNFDKVCDAEFLDHDVTEPDTIKEVAKLTQSPEYLTTVCVCVGGDRTGLTFALELAKILKDSARRCPIVVRMTEESGLAELMDERDRVATTGEGAAAHDALGYLDAFGTVQTSCTLEMLLCEKQDKLARAIHEDYREKEAARQSKTLEELALRSSSLKPWNELNLELKDSNRQQADHLPIKLRAIGCLMVDSDGVNNFEFSPDEVQLLAEMEHDRWMAEKYLAGWNYDATRDNLRKLHPCLLPRHQLSPADQRRDVDAVKNITNLVTLIGKTIVRNPTHPKATTTTQFVPSPAPTPST